MSSSKNADVAPIIKLIVIGDSGVGKSCILLRYCENTFTERHLTTIGIDFKLKTVMLDEKKVKLQIWDTAGQERFQTITQNYYKGSQGIALCYSVNDLTSYEHIVNWMEQIQNHADADVCKILLGNKSDANDRVVTTEQGRQLAEKFKVQFFETSAKSGQNISDAFTAITKQALVVLEQQQDKERQQLENQKPKSKKKRWC